MIEDLDERPEIMKLPEENTKDKLLGTGLDNNLLDLTPETKEKDSILQRKPSTKIRRQLMEWKKIFFRPHI